MPDSVAIVGCGVSGITAAKQAIDYGFEPAVFEQRDDLGGVWNYSEDPAVRTVSFSTCNLYSKELDCFSDCPPNDKHSPLMHHTQMLEYLNHYVDQFKLRHRIRFNAKVVQIQRADDWKDSGHWDITFIDSDGVEKSETFGAVLICTGMHSKPSRPFEYRLEKAFEGAISHSSEVKSVESFKDKTVVLIGFGNSAVQLACDLAPVAKQVYISTRRGSWLLPLLDGQAKPWDLTYNSRIAHFCRKLVPKLVRNWLFEISLNERFDHLAAGVQPDHRFFAANFTFSRTGLEEHLITQRVRIIPNMLSFTEHGVEMIDKSVVEDVDQVVFCTGYSFDFDFVESGKLIFIRENDFHLYKHMFLPDLEAEAKHSNFAVIGHVQPTGPFLPVAEMQARFFFDILSEKYELKSPILMKASLEQKRCQMSIEYVKTRRHTQIEDYTEYMDDLASKIGAKPSLISVFRSSPLLGLKCLFGPNLPFQYRLEGEHTFEDAKNAILTSSHRMNPRGQSRYVKSWQLVLIVLSVLYLWLLFW